MWLNIRELIINAAVHRSYLDHGNIQVAVYDDRLEITSPGKLPMGQTLKRMKEGYSQIRNEALAYAFEYMNLIEHWGSGIPRILGKVKEAGLREPEFIGGEVDLRINIYRGQIKSDGADKTNNGSRIDVSGNDTADKLPESCQNTAGKPSESCQNTAHKLPIKKQDQLIYKYVLENESITTAQAAKLLDIKQRRAREILVKMVEDNWLQKKGASRSTSYIEKPQRKADTGKVSALNKEMIDKTSRRP